MSRNKKSDDATNESVLRSDADFIFTQFKDVAAVTALDGVKSILKDETDFITALQVVFMCGISAYRDYLKDERKVDILKLEGRIENETI